MNAHRTDIGRILAAQSGVIARRDHPELAEAMTGLVRAGRLQPLLPGVYAQVGAGSDPGVLLRALQLWEPNLVFTGATAARLTFWPELPALPIEAAAPTRRARRRAMIITRRRVPSDLVTLAQGLRCTTADLTALDLAVRTAGGSIDAALRSRRVSLVGLHETMQRCARRTGNAQLRSLLLDSRDEPWSAAERQTHGLLRSAGITGWTANYPVPMLSTVYYVDIAFPGARLAIEIDGRAYHGPAQFESDRWRQNDLVLAGWRVLRFTATMIRDQPYIVLALIERALAE